tara:strand:- start:3721 stop:4128 length:408 start_codon:yes stop_codon:yes gene_type:complete
MSSIKPFNKSSWMTKINNETSIDFFFTQRKVVETSEYIDDKTLERKEKKETITHNFLAINLPLVKEDFNNIKIEIWGDRGYNYEGNIQTFKGNFPNLMLKLNDDSEMFIKLIYKNEAGDEKTYTHFINVLKRYQK